MKFGTIAQRMVFALGLALVATTVLAAPAIYRLRVDGLSCPFCAYGIEKKLGAVKGVQRIDVDIASGTVAVTMTEGATLDEAAAKQAVKEAGFSLRGFEQAPAAPQSAPGGKRNEDSDQDRGDRLVPGGHNRLERADHLQHGAAGA